jgi:hypothetical protein
LEELKVSMLQNVLPPSGEDPLREPTLVDWVYGFIVPFETMQDRFFSPECSKLREALHLPTMNEDGYVIEKVDVVAVIAVNVREKNAVYLTRPKPAGA